MSQPKPFPHGAYPQQPYPGFPPPGSSPAAWGDQFGASADANPYASPQIPGGYNPAPQAGGLWREGKMLVMHKLAPLPPICVKSGQPATQWLRRNLAWHPPWIYVLILVHILLYVVVALIMQKKASIQIGLTDEWMARRRTRMLIAWLTSLGGIGLGIVAIALENSGPNTQGYIALLLPAVLMALGGLIYGVCACRLVKPDRITDQYVWLKGVHPSFLDRLPTWPYGIV